MHSYEEFKTEADAAQEYTLANIERLVEDRAHVQICSPKELGEYYRKFLIMDLYLKTTSAH